MFPVKLSQPFQSHMGTYTHAYNMLQPSPALRSLYPLRICLTALTSRTDLSCHTERTSISRFFFNSDETGCIFFSVTSLGGPCLCVSTNLCLYYFLTLNTKHSFLNSEQITKCIITKFPQKCSLGINIFNMSTTVGQQCQSQCCYNFTVSLASHLWGSIAIRANRIPANSKVFSHSVAIRSYCDQLIRYRERKAGRYHFNNCVPTFYSECTWLKF